MSVMPNGTLDAFSESWKYGVESGIHGLAWGRGETVLYSADLNGDGIWTHDVGKDGGLQVLGKFEVGRGRHPRHLVAHPRGRYLYVVMEKENTVVQYALDTDTGAPVDEVDSYSLIPAGPSTSSPIPEQERNDNPQGRIHPPTGPPK